MSSFFQPYSKQLLPLQTETFKRYGGNKKEIKLRSKFEKTVLFNLIERNPSIIKWNYESERIPYYDSIKSKNRYYIPDFYIEFDSNIKMILEVKPYSHVFPSILEVKTSELNEKELFFYNRMIYNSEVNLMKFEAANKWCEEKEIEFCILTELGVFDYKIKNKDN